MKRLTFRYTFPLSLLGVALAGLFLTGCGSAGSGAGSGNGAGALMLTVKWPAPSRLIPAASNSIEAAVFQGAGTNPIGHNLLTRPANGGTSTSTTFNNLNAGTITVAATAFPNADGSGVSQAGGSVQATIVAGQTTSITVTMASTIDHLAITPASPAINVGQSQALTMTAYNLQNEVILTSAPHVTWGTATPANVTVDTTGKVTGVAAGISQITVTENESGKTASTIVTVAGGGGGGCTAGPIIGNGLANSAWPRFGGDNQNHGQSFVNTTAAQGNLNWTAQLGIGVGGPPTMGSGTGGADGTLYVGSYVDYKLNAVNPVDGAVLWKTDLGSGVNTSPALGSNGLIYIGSANTYFGINASNGSIVWSVPANSPGNAAIGGDGTVYVPVINKLLALNKATGATKWAFQTGSPVGGIGAGTPGAPAVSGADGTIYYSGQDGHVYAIEPSCGTQKWKFALGAFLLSHPTLSADGTKLYVHVSNKVYALNASSGTVAWQADVAGGGAVPAVTSNGSVIVMDSNGKLTSLNGATGASQWTFNSGVTSTNGLTVAIARIAGGDVIYFTGTGSQQKLFAVDAQVGTKKWEYVGSMTSVFGNATPIIGASGNIYLHTMDGKLYAVK